MRIYVGNVSYGMTEEELQQTFTEFGEVNSAVLLKDKYTGRAKGFGFVEMPNDDQARAAIEALNGKEISGRTLTVNEARPREERGGGGGGGGQRRSGGFGGGRDRESRY